MSDTLGLGSNNIAALRDACDHTIHPNNKLQLGNINHLHSWPTVMINHLYACGLLSMLPTGGYIATQTGKEYIKQLNNEKDTSHKKPIRKADVGPLPVWKNDFWYKEFAKLKAVMWDISRHCPSDTVKFTAENAFQNASDMELIFDAGFDRALDDEDQIDDTNNKYASRISEAANKVLETVISNELWELVVSIERYAELPGVSVMVTDNSPSLLNNVMYLSDIGLVRGDETHGWHITNLGSRYVQYHKAKGRK